MNLTDSERIHLIKAYAGLSTNALGKYIGYRLLLIVFRCFLYCSTPSATKNVDSQLFPRFWDYFGDYKPK